jgi:hypothetical protein
VLLVPGAAGVQSNQSMAWLLVDAVCALTAAAVGPATLQDIWSRSVIMLFWPLSHVHVVAFNQLNYEAI